MDGVNVIGHLMDSSGLGNTARLFMRALMKRGVSIAGLDVDGSEESADRLIPGVRYCKTVEELPYPVNLLVVSIPLLPSVWRRRFPGLIHEKFTNIGLVFWELPTVPQSWVPSLRMFDAILVSSQYVRSAIESAVPDVRTIFAEHPLDMPECVNEQNLWRDHLGFTNNDVVFAASFDLRSDFSRKNPLGVLAAFNAAFEGIPHARLLLKANGRKIADPSNPRAVEVVAAIKADPRIVFVDRIMPYEEVMHLYAACDAFVSLHRSEGLGLGPMEAMLLAKPVIATGYSGNMTYMTEQNSIPVAYQLVRPAGAAWQFGHRFAGPCAYWAEPDIDSAALAMRKLFGDANLRKSMGSAAQADLSRRQITAWAVPAWDEIRRCLSGKPNGTHRKALLRQIVAQEYLNPILRSKNMSAIIQKFR
jgi:glycosyltransferase involved in cell wall biosynthesis